MAGKKPKPLAAYTLVTSDFLRGMVRLSGARIAGSSLAIAMHQLTIARATGNLDNLVPEENLFRSLIDLSDSELDAFTYVTRTSQLVYATTLLDGFIFDTTLFLYILHPGSMGSKQQLVLEDILTATSRTEILTNLATKKANDCSYLSFKDRVVHLQKTFGLKLTVDAGSWKEIEHFTGLRNVVVHTQSSHRLAFDPNQGVVAVLTLPPEPSPGLM